MTRTQLLLGLLGVLAVGGTLVFAQRYYDRRDARAGVPDWEPDKEFVHDVFTFVRIEYSSGSGYGPGPYGPRGYGRGGRGGRRGFGRGFGGGRWATDYPDSDLNFSYRLHQLTSMEVNPDGLILQLTDPELFHYPFIYIVEPGALVFTEEEVQALRRYLLNGGFLMVDDFWGEDEWYNFYYEIKRVFPEREPVELPISHPIFRAVFDLKEKPQIPSVDAALRGRPYGITWEREDARQVHFKALYDDKGRMMAIICHNSNLGDGSEEEGTGEWYFRAFSEKKGYPMGIKIVCYAITL